SHCVLFFFQAEDGIRDATVTGVQTCALPILVLSHPDRVLSAVVAGAGYGAQPERADAFRAESVLTAAAFAAEGAAKVAERYAIRSEERRVGREGWSGRGGERQTR